MSWQSFWNDVKQGFQDIGNLFKYGVNAQGKPIFRLGSPNDATLQQGLNNFFTGNLDYQRQLDVLTKSNEFSAEQAQIQRAWEERMSNTSIQRGIADAKSAGINPYAVYSGGGASTPQFTAPSSASSQPQKSGQAWGVLASLLGSVLSASISSAARLEATNRQIAQQVNKMQDSFKLAEFRANSASDLVRLKADLKPKLTTYYRRDSKGRIYDFMHKIKS